MKKNCWDLKDLRKKNPKGNQKQKNDEDLSTSVITKEIVMFSYNEDVCTIIEPYGEWIIDSATSYHTTSFKEIFTTYKVSDFGRVKMDNNYNTPSYI